MIEELEHLMTMDASGIASFRDADAMNERIAEWLDTPQNTIADRPGWGHNLATLQHEPGSPDLEVMAEMLIIEKIRRDVLDINVTGVSVEFQEIDLLYVRIDHQYGSFAEPIITDPVKKAAASAPTAVKREFVTISGEITTLGGESAVW